MSPTAPDRRVRLRGAALLPLVVLACAKPPPPAASPRAPEVDGAVPAFASRALRDIPKADPRGWPAEREAHPPGPNPFRDQLQGGPDGAIQPLFPSLAMPVTLVSFLGQGTTLGGCAYPAPPGGEPPGCTSTGDPPDAVGAVGPNHYVQAVNGGIAVWAKDGTPLAGGPHYTSDLWAGYTQADGNHCSNTPAQGGDWGDAIVLYDGMADRWVITQFDVSNDVNNNSGPSYQCVAVSQTGDPTGAYWLYDFQYAAAVNDYGKFGVWPDAYYASYNEFGNFSFLDVRVCAWDRAAMLQGQPATQQCFTSTGFGFLPASVDGQVAPPAGEPEPFVTLGTNKVGLYRFHVDWSTPASSTFTGPTNLTVASYSQLCAGRSCVVQPSPGNALASLGDRPMFHLAYRNFGDHESLLFTHSVTAYTTGGVRWYEIRSPASTPSLFQQGTYAPNDGNYRWMGSIAEDQAGDIAIGYSVSGPNQKPAIAWAGRTAADPPNTMGLAEAIVQAGAGVETGSFSSGGLADRWGDYSNMVVDPADDCTFWYTQELYPANGIYNWDTRVSSVKFPGCAANDFTIGVTPASALVLPGGNATFTVSTAAVKGSAETVAFYAQDLPAGVTASFAPTQVAAGGSTALTLTAANSAPLGASPTTFTVIGKAPSAVHPATASAQVVGCVPLAACPSPDDCGTISDGCGGTLTCGPGCTAPQSCGGGGTANVCGCTPLAACPAPDDCGTIDDTCGGTISCGTCSGFDTCGGGGTANVCGCAPLAACPAPDDCGTIDDTCGGTVSCGTCGASQTCNGNVCANNPPDAGPADSGPSADAGPPDAGKQDGGRADASSAGGRSSRKGGCNCGMSGGLEIGALLGLAEALRRRRR